MTKTVSEQHGIGTYSALIKLFKIYMIVPSFYSREILYFALLMTKTLRRKISIVYWLERREIVRNCAAQNALYVLEIYFPFSSGKSKVYYQQIMGREKFYCNRYYLALADELLPPLNRYRIFHRFHGLVPIHEKTNFPTVGFP